MRTRVYFTVDVECAEERMVRGALQPALGYDLRMWGRFANQREELGIPLLMRELEAYDFRGTFFLEPFGSSYFGIDGLTEVVGALRDRGHDVQLHTHPIQRNAAFRTRGDRPEPDDIGAYPEAEQANILKEGLALLVQAGAPASELLAFRAGNFGANNDTWRAMAHAGLRLSSNYNPCYFGKNCMMRYPRAEAGLFPTMVDGVWELPITCFLETGFAARDAYRHMQIAAVSAREMIECLRQCRALGIGEVTIVTHSFEIYFIDSVKERKGRVNPINLERMRALFRFLREESGEFEVDTVGALAARLPEEAHAARASFPRGKALHRYGRFAEQALKRAAARVPLPLQLPLPRGE